MLKSALRKSLVYSELEWCFIQGLLLMRMTPNFKLRLDYNKSACKGMYFLWMVQEKRQKSLLCSTHFFIFT